jgi:hypothetical protein
VGKYRGEGEKKKMVGPDPKTEKYEGTRKSVRNLGRFARAETDLATQKANEAKRGSRVFVKT